MKEIHNIENGHWDLLAKVWTGNADESETAEAEAWKDQSPENQSAFVTGQKIMDKTGLYFQMKRFNTGEAWEKVSSSIHSGESSIVPPALQNIRSLRLTFLRIAAVLVLALLLGSVGFYIGMNHRKADVFTEVLANDRQVLHDVFLPDGTQVTLNSNSKITFPKEFKGGFREVALEGEGFFHVKPDADTPFVISAGDARIQVLGTSFNVNARRNAQTVEVVVETGKVRFHSNYGQEAETDGLILVQGEKGLLFTESHRLEKTLNDNPNVSAWRTHELIFNHTRLRDVVSDLEKVYHVEIQLSDPSLLELEYTAHFNDQTIDFILDVIRLTFNLELIAENGQYFLTTRTNHP